ncbi:hypothetical protein SAMN05421837_105305 [Amycolatopsis pretoriensis]|uniref:Uncharacterized protein n=1 Tax=Amycolatopsis pretoriensis TaxID=218821 RepID=A0A1H5QZ71_9PSEU|nr:hypothetical protein [Amycolatopsis pretoriensis]SEF30621.1 hypothetical protein SAMN05421837_105305 [Amycolatopsis pretoriensis]
MLRTAPRSATRSSSDRTAVELLDRTGIVAASLPRRRRTDDDLPAAEPIFTRPPVCDQDLRPKSVVIRRRARTWLGSGAAVLLVAAGWLAGGLATGSLFGSPPADVAQLDARPAVAEAPPQAPQAPVATPAPSTVYVPVPAKPATKNVQAKPQPKKKPAETDEARVDLPSPTPTSANLVQSWVGVAESMMQQYQYRADTTTTRR